MKQREIVQKLRTQMPPVFPGSQLNNLTNGIISWRSVQNIRSIDKRTGMSRFPDGTFTNVGRKKIIIDRDKLLRWWETTLSG